MGIRKWVEMDVANIVEYKMCIISRMYIYIYDIVIEICREHTALYSLRHCLAWQRQKCRSGGLASANSVAT